MNMNQPDPGGLFEPLKQRQQAPAANTSVIAQLQNRPAISGSIPRVDMPVPESVPTPAPATAPMQPSGNPLVELSRSGKLKELLAMKAQQMAQQAPAPPPNPLVQLAQNGGIRKLVMAKEDQQYEQALDDYEQWEKSPFRTMGHGGIRGGIARPEPQPPARSFDEIESDWNRGVQDLRGSELGKMLNTLETGQMTPEQEARITQHIEPRLTPKIRQQLQVARLTRDKLETLKQSADQEQQAAQQFGKKSLYMTPGQIASDKDFSKMSETGNVFWRNVGKGVTMGYAFTPDEDRLNSDDADVVADERAKRLFYQQQDEKYPVSMFAGNVLGATPHFVGTGMALRGARVANAMRSVKAGVPTQQAANVIASKGAATTTGGRVAMGAGEGVAYDLLSRPEGAEDMTLAENLQARAKQVGFGVALGGMFELGLLKGGDLWKLAKDKRFDYQLKKETKAAGYGSDTERYINDLLNIERTEDGRLIATAKRESVTDLPDLESVSHEPGTLAAADQPDGVRFDTGTEQPTAPGTTAETGAAQPEFPPGTLHPETVPPADTASMGGPQPAVTPQPAERPGTGEIPPPVAGHTEPPVTLAPEAPPIEAKSGGLEIVEAPVNELTLSSDVPQFKSGANAEGVVEALGGKFDRTGVGPIQVWVRSDGSKEVISGRHRLDLAKRSGENTIPAQYHYEADGFGQQQAATMDAILNIREGQGKVKDYVDYIKGTGLTQEAADAEGILGRATGQRAYTIATDGSDTLIAAHRADRLTDEAATRIARAAPGSERLQSVGIKAIEDGKSITVAENMVKAVRSMTDDTAPTAGDMFGFDDSALRQAEELARKASAKQADIQKTLSAVQGAAKNPKLAAREGVDINDPAALNQRIADLKQQKQDWQNWHTNPELTAELRGEPPPPKNIPEPEPAPEIPESQSGFDLSQPTEAELAARARTEQEAATRTQQQQARQEARAKADTEAKDFELGIQGSGKDVSARQDDMLGLAGNKPQTEHPRNLKSEAETGAESARIDVETPVSSRVVNDTPIEASEFATMKSAVDAADWLINNAKEPVFREIAKTIRGLLDKDTKIVLAGDGQLSLSLRRGQFRYKVDDQGNVLRNHIDIYDQGMQESTLTHELIHAATSLTVKFPKTAKQLEAIERIKDLQERIKTVRTMWMAENLTPDQKAILGTNLNSVDEFVTYSLTNPTYQQALKNLISPSDKVSFYTKLLDQLKKLLGFSKNDGMLENALDASSALIESVEPGYFGKNLNIFKNKDGSITADGQKIPKGGDYVTNTHKGKSTEQEQTSGTLYSNPVNLAIRQMAASMNLGESAASAFGGGVYGATWSDEDIGSEQWWLDVMGGAGLAAFGAGALRYNKVIGKDSLLSNFTRHLGQQYEKIPGLGRGSPEIRKLKKQQQLMRQILNRQTGQMGEFLAKNFTPSERAEMADIIENRGVPKQANFVARQAQELDDIIAYTSERMKELGMLDPGLETGRYLHRYYAKHLKLDMGKDLKKSFQQARKQSLSGSYSIRRGTEETFQAEYLSPAVREQMAEYDRIHTEIKALEKKSGDMLAAQTDTDIQALKADLKGLQDIKLKEFVGIQNGKPHSFVFMPDEVPVIPGLEQPVSKQKPLTENLFSKNGQRSELGNTMGLQPQASDRVWSLRGTVGDQPVLWRDWTKAERESWGEITDAGYRYVRGQAEVAHDLSMATMFKRISDNSDWVSDTPRSVNGEDWVEMPNVKIHKKSPLKKYGALSGKYVKPEIYRAMKYYNQPLFGRGRAATVYRNLLDRWKLYKTVYNPVSHFNNTASNLQMYYMAGYSARNIGNSLSEFRKGENSQYWREARDVGLFGSDWSSSLMEGGEKANSLTELAELLRNQPDMPDADVVVDSLSAINRFKTWWIETGNAVKEADGKLSSGAALAKAVASPTLKTLNKPLKKATDSAKWLYQKEDELFKLAVFIEERKKGVKPYEAMESANRFFFDYNDLPDAVRKMKDFPIGSPFISYTYLALPAIVRNAVERPENMLALAAAFEAVNYASLQLDGKLEDEGYWDYTKAQNEIDPSWQKGRTVWGALNNIDISGFKPGLDSYKISMTNAHAMGNPFAGEGVKDLPLWPGFMAFWGPDPIGGNPVTRIPFDILFNQDWKGDPLYTESDKFEKSLKYAYQAMFPSMPLFPGSWHQKKIIEGMAGDVGKATDEGEAPNRLAEGIVQAANAVSESLGGEQFTGADWKGNQFKTTDALAGSVGIKLRPYKAKDNYDRASTKIYREMQDANTAFNRKTQGNYTKAQMKKFEQAHDERMDNLDAEMDKLDKAYRMVK